MIYRTTGTGKNTYYVVAETIGTNIINIRITDNTSWVGSNTIICTIKADSMADARAIFRVRNMI
jgi:hypothetical protein